MSSDQKKKKKITLPEGFTAEFHFQPMEEQFPNSCKACVTLTHKRVSTPQGKETTGQFFIINIDAKIFNKILAG